MTKYKHIKTCHICTHANRVNIEKDFEKIMIRAKTKTQIARELVSKYDGVNEYSVNAHFYGRKKDGWELAPHYTPTPSLEAINIIDGIQEEYDKAMNKLKSVRHLREQIEVFSESIVSRELKKILEDPNNSLEVSEIVQLLRSVNDSRDKTRVLKLKEQEFDRDTAFDVGLLKALYSKNDTKTSYVPLDPRRGRRANGKNRKGKK